MGFNKTICNLFSKGQLSEARWYFKVGCLLLPFVWAVNAVWFFREAFTKPPFEEQKQIKKYVVMSAGGACAWATLVVAWATVFQLKRVAWGSAGDALSFTVPLGRA